MFTKKEIFAILAANLSIATVVSLSVKSLNDWGTFFFICFGLTFLTIIINILSKKMMATVFEAKIETSLWEFSRFLLYNPFSKEFKNYKPHQKMKNPIPAGFIFPLIIKFLSAGLINWMGCLIFEAKGTIYRAARRFSRSEYPEVSEREMAWIGFMGVFANIIFGILGLMINAPLFSKINFSYALFNSLPVGNLDGMKMFFGKKELCGIALTLSAIGVAASMVLA